MHGSHSAAARGDMPDSHRLRQEGVFPSAIRCGKRVYDILRQEGVYPTAIRCGKRVYARQPYAAAKGYMLGSHTLRQRGVCLAAIRCGKGAYARQPYAAAKAS